MVEWVAVPGYEYIEVTRQCRIRTKGHTVIRKSRWGTESAFVFQPREVKPHVSDNGYKRTHVQRNGRRSPAYVHRLIALTFVNGFEPGFHVNHINGEKLDNRPENLEWVPIEANIRHAWRTGLCDSRGEKAGASKLTAKQVRAIRRALSRGVNTNTLAVISGMSPGCINDIKDGRSWQLLREKYPIA